MLNTKHNLKSGKSKDKKKGFQTENKTGNQKKEKIFQEKKRLQLKMFMLFFSWNERQRRKKNGKETKNKKQK